MAYMRDLAADFEGPPDPRVANKLAQQIGQTSKPTDYMSAILDGAMKAFAPKTASPAAPTAGRSGMNRVMATFAPQGQRVQTPETPGGSVAPVDKTWIPGIPNNVTIVGGVTVVGLAAFLLLRKRKGASTAA